MAVDLIREASKNPSVPGARVIKRQHAREAYSNLTGCLHRFYPLSEQNDVGFFCVIEKSGASDQTHPMVAHAHPDVEEVMYIVSGEGRMILGRYTPGFVEEIHEFTARDVVITPRGIDHILEGEWVALNFHARVNAFSKNVASPRYTHPVVVLNKPERPTKEEFDDLPEPGSYFLVDPTGSRSIPLPDYHPEENVVADMRAYRPDLNFTQDSFDRNAAYAAVTPIEGQSKDPRQLAEMAKNPTVQGARVLHPSDAKELDNPNAGVFERLYPMGLINDMSLVDFCTHDAAADIDREFDSHSHPGIEECMYVLKGTGTMTFGVGEPFFENEYYEFEEGDLVITPRDIPHKNAGDWEVMTFHTRVNIFGEQGGTPRYPHPVIVMEKPPRPTKELSDKLFEPGTYFMVDPTENVNRYLAPRWVRSEAAWANYE